jgi:hypothetical protein
MGANRQAKFDSEMCIVQSKTINTQGDDRYHAWMNMDKVGLKHNMRHDEWSRDHKESNLWVFLCLYFPFFMVKTAFRKLKKFDLVRYSSCSSATIHKSM